jgi:cohesin loading factor subunit SCC2
LLALQGDVENFDIRTHALQLLMIEGEKRPDILRQRICAGVKQAYYLQRSINYERNDVSAVVPVKRGGRHHVEYDCIFSSVYKECIARNRKQRQGLYKNLLGLFDAEDSSSDESLQRIGKNSKKQDVVVKRRDIALLSFVAQVLAHLPYSTADDPLFIVYHLSSIVALQGPLCLDRFASFLRTHGLASDDALDENNVIEDALERAANSKFPSRTNEAQPLNSEKFDMQEFTDLCRDGTCLCILLRLKSFLCSSYNLSLMRCMEYEPNAKERIRDKSVLRATLTKPFDVSFASRVSVASSNIDDGETKNVVDKDALIRQYAEFRRRMREEHSCDPDDIDDNIVAAIEVCGSKITDGNVDTLENDTDNDSSNSIGEERVAVHVAEKARKVKRRGRKSKK